VQVHQLLQPVVAVDDATIKVVQIGGGETSASSGTRGRSSGGITGTTSRIIHCGKVSALAERLDNLQTLGVLDALSAATPRAPSSRGARPKARGIDALEQFLDGFRAHHRLEARRAELAGPVRELRFVLDDFAFFTGASPGSITT